MLHVFYMFIYLMRCNRYWLSGRILTYISMERILTYVSGKTILVCCV